MNDAAIRYPQTDDLIIQMTQWKCRWHGDRGNDGGLWLLGDNFCSMCLHQLLSTKLYPMKQG